MRNAVRNARKIIWIDSLEIIPSARLADHSVASTLYTIQTKKKLNNVLPNGTIINDFLVYIVGSSLEEALNALNIDEEE